MTNRLAFALAAPLLIVLAACVPVPTPSASNPPSTPETAVPETPLADGPAPIDIDPADYLVEYWPEEAEAELHELFHYAFWTAEDRTVRCDVWVGGQSDPFTECFVMRDAEGLVTYKRPAADCSETAAPMRDGFGVMLNAIPADAGYAQPRAQITGCATERPFPLADIAAATLVLPDGAALDVGPFRCTVVAEVGTCVYTELGASVSIGLSAISVAN